MKVFISYSRDSEEHCDLVLAFSDLLRKYEIDAVLDQYEECPPQGWTRWMDNQIKQAEFVLIICSESYWHRIDGIEEDGRGLGVYFESTLTYNYIYFDKDRMSRFIPVLFNRNDLKYVPTPLKGFSYYCVDNKKEAEALYRRLTHQPSLLKPELGLERKPIPTDPKSIDFSNDLVKLVEKEKENRQGQKFLNDHKEPQKSFNHIFEEERQKWEMKKIGDRRELHQVFISYSNERSDNATNTESDRDIADMICSALEAKNIRCWIDYRDILPGEDWLNSIIDAVEQSKIIVLIFSSNSEKSRWVKDEITLALDNNMKIIPFRIENFPPQGTFRVLKLRSQWIDAFTPPLEKHVDRLVKAVCSHLEKNEKNVDE